MSISVFPGEKFREVLTTTFRLHNWLFCAPFNRQNANSRIGGGPENLGILASQRFVEFSIKIKRNSKQFLAMMVSWEYLLNIFSWLPLFECWNIKIMSTFGFCLPCSYLHNLELSYQFFDAHITFQKWICHTSHDYKYNYLRDIADS